MNEIVGKRDAGRVVASKGDAVEAYAVAADACGPKVCFSMEAMTPRALRQFVVDAALRTPYATRPSGPPGSGRAEPPAPQGDPRHARHTDQGVTVGWSPRQQAAFIRLQGLWKSALRGWTGPGGYDSGGGGGGGTSIVEEDAAGQALAEFRLAMGQVHQQCSPSHAAALRMVVEGEPSRGGGTILVREALTFLANLWGVK